MKKIKENKKLYNGKSMVTFQKKEFKKSNQSAAAETKTNNLLQWRDKNNNKPKNNNLKNYLRIRNNDRCTVYKA